MVLAVQPAMLPFTTKVYGAWPKLIAVINEKTLGRTGCNRDAMGCWIKMLEGRNDIRM